MGVFPGDVVIAETLRRGLEDLRKDIWLLDDIFGHFKNIESLKDKYGQKEIDAAKEWFTNNAIDVVMRYRVDKEEMPCVTIALGQSGEKDEMKHLGEESSEVETLMPSQTNKPIPYIVKSFTPESVSGLVVKIPAGVSARAVRAGMVLVDTNNGNGFVIESVAGKEITLKELADDQELTGNRFAIIPQFPFYRVRRKHSFFQESYQIGCHVHGDPAPLLWLHSIISYILLRYRESMLEGQCFAESTISSTDMVLNNDFSTVGGDRVYSRYITLTGQVEHSWLSSPQRVIEAIELTEETDEGIKTGIKICSNLDSPANLNTEDDSWVTTDGEE